MNRQIFLVTEIDGDMVHLINEITRAELRISLIQLLRPELTSDSGTDQILFEPTLEKLNKAIESLSPLPDPTNENQLPEKSLKRADQIILVVETVEAYIAEDLRRLRLANEPQALHLANSIKRALRSLSREDSVSRSTYYKYRHIYNQHSGNRTAIAAALRRKTFGQNRQNDAVLHFVDTMVIQLYARSNQKRISTVYDDMCKILAGTRGYWADPSKCGDHVPQELIDQLLDSKLPIEVTLENPESAACLTQIKMPSRSWFYTYLRWFSNHPDHSQLVVTRRHGKDEWEKNYLVFDSFVHQATFPLQYVFVDHWMLDVFTIDEETRSKHQRLWLTVFIDAKTRSILGRALLHEHPCIESIQTGLLHTIWPKDPKQDWGIEEPWDCYGIPQRLFLDNAWAHHSHSVEQLFSMIGFKGKYTTPIAVFRPPYKARYGAIIERFFGNLSAQVKESLPGAILSRDSKHMAKARKEACLLFNDVLRFLDTRIVEYMHTPHSELNGMTPHEAWTESIGQFGCPLVPKLTPELRHYFWRMDPRQRTLSSHGISAFGMHYWSPDLMNVPRIGKNGQRVKYTIRYDPNEINRIALFVDEDNSRYVSLLEAKDLRRSDNSLRPLSLAERNMAVESAKAKGKSASTWLDEMDVASGNTDFDDVIAVRQKQKRNANRQPPQSSPPTTADILKSESAIQATQKNISYNSYDDKLQSWGRK